MTIPAGSGGGAPGPGPGAVMSQRRLLINLAYRLLGSLTDAEDAVQEAYARWYALSGQQQDAIESPGAWLAKVASRVCLDLLGSARARRERYVGEWLPEPLPGPGGWISGRPGGGPADPADRVTLDESVGMAFLVVLEAVTPAERVAPGMPGTSAPSSACSTPAPRRSPTAAAWSALPSTRSKAPGRSPAAASTSPAWHPP